MMNGEKITKGVSFPNKGPKARHHISIFFSLSKTSYMATSGFTKKPENMFLFWRKLSAEIECEGFIAHLCEKRQ